MLFDPDKCKFLNIVVYLLPHGFSIDSKFKEPAVFEANEDLKVILIICIFMQFFNFAQGEMKEGSINFEHYLVIGEYEDNFFILSVDGFGAYKFGIYKYGYLSFCDLIFLYS